MAKQSRTKAVAALDALEAKLGKAPDLSGLAVKADLLAEERAATGELTGEIATLKKAETSARKALVDSTSAEKRAVAAVEALQSERAELMEAHAAHAVRARLQPGEPCPVCEQVVAKVPKGATPAALDSLKPARGGRRGRRCASSDGRRGARCGPRPRWGRNSRALKRVRRGSPRGSARSSPSWARHWAKRRTRSSRSGAGSTNSKRRTKWSQRPPSCASRRP